MTDIKLLGNVEQFDPESNLLTLKLDFLNIQKQELIEQLLLGDIPIAFRFTKPGKKEKTYLQLKRYFWMLKLILKAKGVFPDAKSIKTIDFYIKKSLIECEYLEFKEGEEIIRIPIIPSKADMSIEELNSLMNAVEENYDYLKINWETGVINGGFHE